jgi:hypothetical protein
MSHFGRAPSRSQIESLLNKPAPAAPRPFKCGHDRSDGNTYWTDTGSEQCRTCRRTMEATAQKQYRERQKRQRTKMPAFSVAPVEELQPIVVDPDKARLSSLTLEKVAKAFRLEPADLLADRRQMRLVVARAVVVRIMRDRGASYPLIAKRLNKICHSSIRNLDLKFDAYCKRFPEVLAIHKALTK